MSWVEAYSTMRPAYITAIVSVTSATTPRSWVIRITAMSSSRWRRAISSRICACTVTSSAVVGSSAIRSRGSFTSAIAIIARWRMPPQNSCGEEAKRRAGARGPPTPRNPTARGIRDPDHPEELDGALARLALRQVLVRLDRLHQLLAHLVERVQRGERI